jgi:hypothetical protein
VAAGYDPAVIPLLLLVPGLAALAGGVLLLRSLGDRGRIGRILAATPVVPVDEAVRLARAGEVRYVGVGGRLDSDEEFFDEHERPLVFRHSRLDLRAGSRWRTVRESRELAPFSVAGGLASIAVDGVSLDEGVVVVPRESVGTAGEVPDRVPEGTDPATPARLRVDLLSTVDHALVLGVPSLDPERGPLIGPGLGRPLILTTLEPAEAMRVLASGHRTRTRGAALLLAGGLGAVVAGAAWALVDALA